MGKYCESWSPAVPETTRVRTRNDAVTGGRGGPGPLLRSLRLPGLVERESERESVAPGSADRRWGCRGRRRQGCPAPPRPRRHAMCPMNSESPSPQVPVGASWTRSLPSQVSLGAQNKSWVRPGLCPWDLHVQRGNETCRRRTWGGATHMKRCYGNSMTNPEDHIFLFKWVYFDMLVSCAFVHPSYLKMCPAA